MFQGWIYASENVWINAYMWEFPFSMHTFLCPTRFIYCILSMWFYIRDFVCAHLHWAVSATWGFQIGFQLLGGGLCQHWGFWFTAHSQTAMHDRLLPFTAEKEGGKEGRGKLNRMEKVSSRQKGETGWLKSNRSVVRLEKRGKLIFQQSWRWCLICHH